MSCFNSYFSWTSRAFCCRLLYLQTEMLSVSLYLLSLKQIIKFIYCTLSDELPRFTKFFLLWLLLSIFYYQKFNLCLFSRNCSLNLLCLWGISANSKKSICGSKSDLFASTLSVYNAPSCNLRLQFALPTASFLLNASYEMGYGVEKPWICLLAVEGRHILYTTTHGIPSWQREKRPLINFILLKLIQNTFYYSRPPAAKINATQQRLVNQAFDNLTSLRAVEMEGGNIFRCTYTQIRMTCALGGTSVIITYSFVYVLRMVYQGSFLNSEGSSSAKRFLGATW